MSTTVTKLSAAPERASARPPMTTVKLLLAWLLVAVPLGWGVTKSVQKSLPLFRPAAQPAAVMPK
jgi:hypothetical protein